MIQTLFGWTDTHLHQFFIAGTSYGQPDDFDQPVVNESVVMLSEALGTETKRFLYVYDFGDYWQHEVVVEKIVSGNCGSERLLWIGGRQHRSPEDCGAPRGYTHFLAVIRNPNHDEHAAMLEWAGGIFDPGAFDLALVNRELAVM